jgi:hypothetical protein
VKSKSISRYKSSVLCLFEKENCIFYRKEILEVYKNKILFCADVAGPKPLLFHDGKQNHGRGVSDEHSLHAPSSRVPNFGNFKTASSLQHDNQQLRATQQQARYKVT